ncbi:unnamed protein product, partial [Tetraodon nigroviridis]
RSIQRQSSSSRSSIASPLVFSDTAIKPSWSLAAKLNMRSNSPSRFSLDSRCSPPLERIGECCDDKVSTSCFGSYSRHERYFGSRSPLSAVESNVSEPDGKRFIDMMYCRAPTPVEKKSGKHEATENNNQITVERREEANPQLQQQLLRHQPALAQRGHQGAAARRQTRGEGHVVLQERAPTEGEPASADLGKSSALVKKASERTSRQNGQAEEAKGAGAPFAPPASAEMQGGETKASSKAPSSLSRTLLGKSKSSTSDVSLSSPASGKRPLERAASSRKLPSAAQSPAHAAQRPQ